MRYVACPTNTWSGLGTKVRRVAICNAPTVDRDGVPILVVSGLAPDVHLQRSLARERLTPDTRPVDARTDVHAARQSRVTHRPGVPQHSRFPILRNSDGVSDAVEYDVAVQLAKHMALRGCEADEVGIGPVVRDRDHDVGLEIAASDRHDVIGHATPPALSLRCLS